MSIRVPDGYDYQPCGLCEGTGESTLNQGECCPPCKGAGRVLVHRPPIQCVRCNGAGKFIPRNDKNVEDFILCVVCHGGGWLMTLIR